MTLEMTLCGEGVLPAVTSSHPGGLLDFGYVLKKESASQVLKVSPQCAECKQKKYENETEDIKSCYFLQLQNSSAVSVGFRVLQASLCPSRHQGGADMVDLLLGCSDSQVQPTVGKMSLTVLLFTRKPDSFDC